MTHTPRLVVIDEVDTPRLRILAQCIECDVTISEREFDASDPEGLERDDYGALSGTMDAEAWLKHAGQEA